MSTLRLSVQENLIPGNSLEEKFENAVRAGYDALELKGHGDFGLEKRIDELKSARAAGVLMPTECVAMDHFIGAFDATARQDAVANMKSQITTIVAAGGYGAITPAAYGMFSLKLPHNEPPRSIEEDEQILVNALYEIGKHAEQIGGILLLEPLNRYEDHMVNTLARAAELCEKVNLSSVGIVADTYHMNIEEDDIHASIISAQKWIKHVQLGDSSRFQPGTGHFDWATFLSAMHEIGYDGYMAIECGLRGDPLHALAEGAAFMRKNWVL